MSSNIRVWHHGAKLIEVSLDAIDKIPEIDFCIRYKRERCYMKKEWIRYSAGRCSRRSFDICASGPFASLRIGRSPQPAGPQDVFWVIPWVPCFLRAPIQPATHGDAHNATRCVATHSKWHALNCDVLRRVALHSLAPFRLAIGSSASLCAALHRFASEQLRSHAPFLPLPALPPFLSTSAQWCALPN